MKKCTLIALFLVLLYPVQAQPGGLFGIVSKNYYSQVPDPFNPGQTYEQFDSATIRLGILNLNTGFVANQGNNVYREAINLTGAALNPYDNTYIFIGASNLNTIDLSSGAIVNQVPLSNPLGDSYFDNFRFNHSDSTMYGLARRYIPDPNGPFGTGEVFLAKANTTTGEITQLSTTSVGQGFALSGSAIDSYEMVYYFSTGSTLVGLDLYDGSVYSEVPFGLPTGAMFNNFTYSCADTALYGLVNQSFYTNVADPFFPGDSIQVLDSSTVRLGKIDPNTGAVTILSPYSVAPQAGFSLNAGAAIDPFSLTYYYSNGSHLVGISMITGLQTSYLPFSFAMGDYFNLMRNTENCYFALARRENSRTSLEPENQAIVSLYPNPTSGFLQINSSEPIRYADITAVDGKLLRSFTGGEISGGLDMSDLAPGMYLMKLVLQNKQEVVRKWVKS